MVEIQQYAAREEIMRRRLREAENKEVELEVGIHDVEAENKELRRRMLFSGISPGRTFAAPDSVPNAINATRFNELLDFHEPVQPSTPRPEKVLTELESEEDGYVPAQEEEQPIQGATRGRFVGMRRHPHGP